MQGNFDQCCWPEMTCWPHLHQDKGNKNLIMGNYYTEYPALREMTLTCWVPITCRLNSDQGGSHGVGMWVTGGDTELCFKITLRNLPKATCEIQTDLCTSITWYIIVHSILLVRRQKAALNGHDSDDPIAKICIESNFWRKHWTMTHVNSLHIVILVFRTLNRISTKWDNNARLFSITISQNVQ